MRSGMLLLPSTGGFKSASSYLKSSINRALETGLVGLLTTTIHDDSRVISHDGSRADPTTTTPTTIHDNSRADPSAPPGFKHGQPAGTPEEQTPNVRVIVRSSIARSYSPPR